MLMGDSTDPVMPSPSFLLCLAGAAVAPVVPLPAGRTESTASDAKLVSLALEGSDFAHHELYRRHVRLVAARVTRLLSRSTEAEDVVQEAFLEAFRDLAGLRDPERFGAWLMGIAVHRAQRQFRRRRLRRRLGLDRQADDAALENLAAPESRPELRLELARLDRALSTLGADLRLAWMLRMVEGCELQEVARLCGCSLATAKRRVARARDIIAARTGFKQLREVQP
jgi:RNA polymerase sigma-70 factor (ECF subfamily)